METRLVIPVDPHLAALLGLFPDCGIETWFDGEKLSIRVLSYEEEQELRASPDSRRHDL